MKTQFYFYFPLPWKLYSQRKLSPAMDENSVGSLTFLLLGNSPRVILKHKPQSQFRNSKSQIQDTKQHINLYSKLRLSLPQTVGVSHAAEKKTWMFLLPSYSFSAVPPLPLTSSPSKNVEDKQKKWHEWFVLSHLFKVGFSFSRHFHQPSV